MAQVKSIHPRQAEQMKVKLDAGTGMGGDRVNGKLEGVIMASLFSSDFVKRK